MDRIRNLLNTARRFGADRSGNFAILTGAALSTLVMSAGFGVNTAQMISARSSLLSALDMAVTSTSRDLTTGVIREEDARKSVEAFLFANGNSAFASADRVTLDNLVVNRAAKTVEASASVEIDLAFPVFQTEKTKTLSVESASIYSDRKIEVAMMLDVTGSMRRNGPRNKLGDLQKAAKNAVNTLLASNKASNPRVRVSIVPYANSVNVGKSIAEQAVFVETRLSDRRQAPSNRDPRVVSGASRPDYCATERKGADAYTDAGPESSMVNRDLLLTDFARGNERRFATQACPSTALVPLTTNARTLTSTIDSFVANGGTGGHIGIQWTWYMLSERWKDVVGRTAAAEKADARKVAKYAILMTDGEFNLSYVDASTDGEVYDDAGKRQTREEAEKLCRAMRAQGIEIFTVGFDLQDQRARETMRNCASPDTAATKYYYEASTGQQLDDAFQAIAANIESLAITR